MIKIDIMPMGCGVDSFPEYQTDGASGMDLKAAILSPIEICPGECKVIRCGFRIAIPEGYEGQIRSRSSLAIKGLVVINSPGTIDSDYRGEVKVALFSHNNRLYRIDPNQRIAQLVICPVVRVELNIVNSLSNTKRGNGGFGSTGV